MLSSETGRQRILRRLRRLIPPRSFRCIQQRCRGRGIEIGGPSAVFRRWNLWPIYPVAGTLDGYNFAPQTLWSQPAGTQPRFYSREFVGEASEMSELTAGTYGFLLASHVLEHIANPLKALHTWKRIVRPDGLILIVVPHRDGTFDHRRPVTTLDHIVADYQQNVGEGDETHLPEIAALHDLTRDPGAGSREAFLTRANKNVQYRSLHHHVFDTELVLRLLDRSELAIEYLDIEMPYHVCVACSPASGAGSMNAPYFAASATWRARSRFPSDHNPGHRSGRS